jgi:hypothetical protein
MRDRDGELYNDRLVPLDGDLMSAPKRKVASKPIKVLRATQFTPVHFFDPELKRQVIILYALGEDGIVYEYTNQKWNPYPITR